MKGWIGTLMLASSLLAGCASPTKQPTNPEAGVWSGRIALSVKDKPADSFSSSFELRGNAQSGELTLVSPLGSALAVLNWQPGKATLRSGGQTREFDSPDALIAQATGSAVPVAALFEWLRGSDANVPGWRADLSEYGEGRISAKRVDPPPEADLRVVLEK